MINRSASFALGIEAASFAMRSDNGASKDRAESPAALPNAQKTKSYLHNHSKHKINPRLREISVFNIFFPANNGFVNPSVTAIFAVENVVYRKIEIQCLE